MKLNNQITKEKLSKILEHTILKANATKEEISSLCKTAIEYNIATVVVNSAYVKFCKEILAGSDVRIGATVSFPLGATTLETKLFEAKNAIADGADEIDYVINITEMKNGNYDL